MRARHPLPRNRASGETGRGPALDHLRPCRGAVYYDEITGTPLCGDLFTAVGPGPSFRGDGGNQLRGQAVLPRPARRPELTFSSGSGAVGLGSLATTRRKQGRPVCRVG